MASAPKDEEVRSVIRSILVSNPNEMSAFLLDRDFREMEGYSIPYSRFGYKSLLDYLYSIPDTVTVKGSVVLPVTTEKAAHVEKMVLKQKSSTSHRRQPPRRSRNHGVSRNRSMGPPPPRPSHERTQSTHQATTSIPSIFDLKFDPLAMEKLKGGPSFNGAQTFNDTSLVANGPLRNYSPNVNNPPFIPAYPFSNNNSMPQAQAFLPNVSFQPSRRSLNNMKPPLFEDPVPGLPPKPFKANEPRWNQPNVCAKNNSGLLLQTVQPKPTTFITSPKDSTGNNNASWAKNRKFVNAIPAGAESSAGLDQFSSGSRSDDESAGNDYESGWGKKSGAESYYARSAKSDGSVNNDYADSPISIKMQENFKILLKKYPDGFFCSELPGLYENEFHAPFSCQDYGYNSIIQMVSDHPGIFSFSRFEKHGDWLLKQPGGIEEKKSEKSMKRWLPRKIIQNITRILEQFPGGLPISQLLVKYKEFVNETLDFGHYGESLQVVIDDLENYVHQRRVGDDILLYEASRFKKSDLGISENLAVTPALPNVEMSLLHKDLYPKECCSHDDVIPVQKLLQPTDSHYIKVLVSDLENPYNLWFQLGVCYNALRTMMNDLHEFYSRHESKYVMPELTIRPRQLCACVFPDGGEEKWHRAIILTCQKDQIKVLIEYIDYGTRMEVSRTILRFLHKDFSKLPCQAIKGRLSGVYPQIGCTDWPKVVNLRLRSLTIDRWLMIEVVKERDGVIEVFLYDTSTDEDIVVNDELISSGHARGYDEQLDNSESLVVGAFASYLNSPNSSVKSEKSAPWNCSPDKQTSIDTSLKYYNTSTTFTLPDPSSDYYKTSEQTTHPLPPYAITSGSGTSTSGFIGSPVSPLSRHSNSPNNVRGIETLPDSPDLGQFGSGDHLDRGSLSNASSRYSLNRSCSTHSSPSPLGLSSPSTSSLKSESVGDTFSGMRNNWKFPLPPPKDLSIPPPSPVAALSPVATPSPVSTPPPATAPSQEPYFRRPPPGFSPGTSNKQIPTPAVSHQLPFVSNYMPPPQNNWNTTAINQAQQFILIQQLQQLQQQPSYLLPNQFGLGLPAVNPMLNNPLLNTMPFQMTQAVNLPNHNNNAFMQNFMYPMAMPPTSCAPSVQRASNTFNRTGLTPAINPGATATSGKDHSSTPKIVKNVVEEEATSSLSHLNEIPDSSTQPNLEESSEIPVSGFSEPTNLTCIDTESVISDWEAEDTADEAVEKEIDSDIETVASAKEISQTTAPAASNPLMQRTAKPMSRSGRKRLRKSMLKKALIPPIASETSSSDVTQDSGKEVEDAGAIVDSNKPEKETKDKSKKNKKKSQEQNSTTKVAEPIQTKAKKLAAKSTSLRRPKDNILLEIALEDSIGGTPDQKTSTKDTEDKKIRKSSIVEGDKSEKSSADKGEKGKLNKEKIETSSDNNEENKKTSPDEAKIEIKNDKSIVEDKNVSECRKEFESDLKDDKSDKKPTKATDKKICSDNFTKLNPSITASTSNANKSTEKICSDNFTKLNPSITASTSNANKSTESDKKLVIDSNSEAKGKNKLDLKRELVKDWKMLDSITKDSIYVSKPAKPITSATKAPHTSENPATQCDILDRIISSVGAHVFNIAEEEKIESPPKDPIQKKVINNQTIHVFEFTNQPTVCTDEIITCFTKFTKRLAVNKALDCKQAVKPYFDITRKNNAQLFKLLDNCKISGVTKEKETQIPDKLSVLPLEVVSNLLRNLGADSSVIDSFSNLSEELNKAS